MYRNSCDRLKGALILSKISMKIIRKLTASSLMFQNSNGKLSPEPTVASDKGNQNLDKEYLKIMTTLPKNIFPRVYKKKFEDWLLFPIRLAETTTTQLKKSHRTQLYTTGYGYHS